MPPSPTDQVNKNDIVYLTLLLFLWGQCGILYPTPLKLHFTNTVINYPSPSFCKMFHVLVAMAFTCVSGSFLNVRVKLKPNMV